MILASKVRTGLGLANLAKMLINNWSLNLDI